MNIYSIKRLIWRAGFECSDHGGVVYMHTSNAWHPVKASTVSGALSIIEAAKRQP